MCARVFIKCILKCACVCVCDAVVEIVCCGTAAGEIKGQRDRGETRPSELKIYNLKVLWRERERWGESTLLSKPASPDVSSHGGQQVLVFGTCNIVSLILG